MTRAECETRIAEHVEAIIQLAKEYSPGTEYFTACYSVNDGREAYYFQKEYFNECSPDANHPLNFSKRIVRNWRDVRVEFDHASNSYTVYVDGKVEREHLAKDEVAEVVQSLMP